MDNICDICVKKPGSHSFTYLCKTTKKDLYEYVFYTCIGDSKAYNDADNVVKHYENCLTVMNPDKWIWIFNCDGFEYKHYAEISTIVKLVGLINKIGKIEAIYIVNTCGLLDMLLKVIKPLLDLETFQRIKVIDSVEILNKIDLKPEDKTKIKKLLVTKYEYK